MPLSRLSQRRLSLESPSVCMHASLAPSPPRVKRIHDEFPVIGARNLTEVSLIYKIIPLAKSAAEVSNDA